MLRCTVEAAAAAAAAGLTVLMVFGAVFLLAEAEIMWAVSMQTGSGECRL